MSESGEGETDSVGAVVVAVAAEALLSVLAFRLEAACLCAWVMHSDNRYSAVSSGESAFSREALSAAITPTISNASSAGSLLPPLVLVPSEGNLFPA